MRDKDIRWVLLEDVGVAVVRDDVPEALVREVLEELRGQPVVRPQR